jgi:PAS domain S-box-containing protein
MKSLSQYDIRNLFQQSLQSFVLVSEAGIVKDINLQAEKLLGYHRLEMLNKSISLFLSTPSELLQRIVLMENGNFSGLKLEVQFIPKNGSKLWIELLINKYPSENGNVCLMALHDISGHIQLEKEFVENQKRISNFGYLTSHTLRLPIANIMGLSSLFDEEGIDQENKKELIANLKTSAFQLNEAVHQLNNVIHSLKSFNEKRTFYKPGRRPSLIMLVDDDIINNFVNKKLIQKFDPRINVVDLTSGQQAITKLQSGLIIPDILFLDLSMPIFDGWRFLDELQKQPISDCRVILLCTTIASNDVLRASQYPFVIDIVEKPMNIEKLQTLIYPEQE